MLPYRNSNESKSRERDGDVPSSVVVEVFSKNELIDQAERASRGRFNLGNCGRCSQKRSTIEKVERARRGCFNLGDSKRCSRSRCRMDRVKRME